MFFESTYLPSPQLATRDLNDSTISDLLSPVKEELPLPDLDTSEETPVNHLVFVIHGIGQQTEQNGYFYENIKNLQETTRQVLQAKMPDRNVRIELVPIEWHRHIHDQVDPTMNRITLKTIPTIRFIENDYLADVLFYFTKNRGQSIIDNVTQLFNTSYQNFMEKHPEFDGKIVILGYSLGGILIWDILSHQRKPSSIEEELDYDKLDIIYSKLDFKPDYFFSLGSPLAAVLTIRNQSPVTYHPDHDIVFENMFHPFDPLAYRMEPLFDDYYTYQPAAPVERSVPTGPSFSFPSLPSFANIDLSSFFSWKMPSAGARNDSHLNSDTTPINHNETVSTTNDHNTMGTYDTSYTMNQKQLLSLSSSSSSKKSTHYNSQTGNMQPTHPHNASTAIMENGHLLEKGIMHKFLKYFGKHRRHGDKDSNHSTADDYHTTNNTTAPDTNEDPAHQMPNSNNAAHGIITWDLLQEHQQQHAVSSTDGKSQGPLWKTLMGASEGNDSSSSGDTTRSISSMSSSLSSSTLSSTTILPGRGSRQRSKTYGAQASSSGEPGTNNSNHHYLAFGNVNNNKTGKAPSTYLQHLVNTLGLDSVGIESFEPRTPFNFASRHSRNNNLQGQALDTDVKIDRSTPSMEKAATQGFWAVGAINDQHTDLPAAVIEPTNVDGSSNKKMDPHQELEEAEKLTAPMSMDDDETNPNTRAQQQYALEYLPGHRRMDFSLQPDGLMSMIANEYLVGLRAHFSYWTSKDLMWHILQALEK